MLAQRLKSIKPSPTLTIAAKARQLQAEGQNILNLSTGEPDFATPDFICQAAHRAIDDGYTKYTAVDGLPSLKQAIMTKFMRDNHLAYKNNEVMASTGCKQVLYNAFQALLDADDEVIIPAPYWVSYPDLVLLAQGHPKIITTTVEQNFKMTASQLADAITPKTKALLLNSPSNPTGVVYTAQELAAFAEVLLAHPKIWIISDDIYQHIYWHPEPFYNIVNVCPDLKTRTLICHGVSKTYAMTGWRIGFAAGPAELIHAMTIIQSQSTSNPNAIAQMAATAALLGNQLCITPLVAAYQRRHDLLYDAFQQLAGVSVCRADGAFYSFIHVEKAIVTLGNFADDMAFSEFLLTRAGISVIPGSAFGAPNCLRFSCAASDAVLMETIARLQKLWRNPSQKVFT